ncbi:hypothetical protein BMR1_02g01535 [Babesia microti strain RI]|uniref:Uncharacterized protein n=1 Tax=Babesia microti (strain RI) TaxID=1133968 RepID=I7I8P9_BABMR|nr:hypothetical protein BMR1_02g01535 [Babesia microti strain RI]CCF73468.1 hypothetical protein BMR1_02g01535 [Babesia microti strain RI]|eukprot:XP_012648077.1 hypothetical protein BMR1_02g01535 [Babesia microti strain RI]
MDSLVNAGVTGLNASSKSLSRFLRGPIAPMYHKQGLLDSKAAVHPKFADQVPQNTQPIQTATMEYVPNMKMAIPTQHMEVMQPTTFHPHYEITANAMNNSPNNQIDVSSESTKLGLPGTIPKHVMDEHSMFASTSYSPLRIDSQPLFGKAIYGVIGLCASFIVVVLFMNIYRSKKSKKTTKK